MSFNPNLDFRKNISDEAIQNSDNYYFTRLPRINFLVAQRDYDLIKSYTEEGINQYSQTAFWSNPNNLTAQMNKIFMDSAESAFLKRSNEITLKNKMGFVPNQTPVYDFSPFAKGQCIMVFLGEKDGCDNYEKAFRNLTKISKVENNWEIGQLHSPADTNRWMNIIQTNTTDKNFLLITCGSGTTGISIPKLIKLVFELDTHSPIRIFQSAGRLLRSYDGKKNVYVYFNSKDVALKATYFAASYDAKRKNKSVKESLIDWTKVINLSIMDGTETKLVDVNSAWNEIMSEIKKDIVSGKRIDEYCDISLDDFSAFGIELDGSFNLKVRKNSSLEVEVFNREEETGEEEPRLSGVKRGPKAKGKKNKSNNKEDRTSLISLGGRIQTFIKMTYECYGMKDFVEAVRAYGEDFEKLTRITPKMFQYCLDNGKFDLDRLNLVYTICETSPESISVCYSNSETIIPKSLYSKFVW